MKGGMKINWRKLNLKKTQYYLMIKMRWDNQTLKLKKENQAAVMNLSRHKY